MQPTTTWSAAREYPMRHERPVPDAQKDAYTASMLAAAGCLDGGYRHRIGGGGANSNSGSYVISGHEVALLTFRNGKDAMPPDAGCRLFSFTSG
jgi:hypothetical protein